MRPTAILSAVCLLLAFWSVIAGIIMLSAAGPNEDMKERNERSLHDIEVQIENYDRKNRQQLVELQKEITDLKAALQNHTQYLHQDLDLIKDDADLDNGGPEPNENDIDTKNKEMSSVNDVPSTSFPQQRVNASFDNNEPIAVLVIACNREFVSRSIDALLRYRPSKELFPIIVSQDCEHEGTSNVIDSYGDEITHINQPDQSDDFHLKGKERKMKGYYRIARHYKWALGQVFDVYGYNYGIIVEDDIEVAPDFFSYFQATRPLLATDRSLWCVSAWNDNGKELHIDKEFNDKLYRTDFFPGLGWMLTVHLWHELKEKWPDSYWDDWMRQEYQRKGRSCIRPEISRTITFGKKGVSHGQYYERHLKFIILNEKPYDFMSTDLNFLLKDNYDEIFVKRVLNLKTVTLSEVLHSKRKEEIQIKYSTIKEFQSFAKHLKIMSDLRSNIPRTAYKGIVSFRRAQRRIHLTPSFEWTSYFDIRSG